jgi:mannose-6-phosphate isomerase-like protein (cupin superfamily)
MVVFDLASQEEFNPRRHVEKVLGRVADGDFSIACWEADQASPYHCHPQATEIYICISGGGVMKTPERTVSVKPGCFVVHPPGELHEYTNGSERTVLMRIRYGADMASRIIAWPSNPEWVPRPQDTAPD